MTKRVFLTGANRGIGLEFTRQLVASGARVFAGARDPKGAAELAALATDNLTLIRIDVTDEASIIAAAEAVSAHTPALDLVINNAAVLNNGERIHNFDEEAFNRTFAVNVTGPALVTKHFVPLLEGGTNPILVNITSQLGSLARKSRGSTYSYSASKAALNMLTKAMTYELEPKGITAVMLHPGWVQTDMGGESATLTPTEAVRGMLQVIGGLTLEASGAFLQWDGQQLPW